MDGELEVVFVRIEGDARMVAEDEGVEEMRLPHLRPEVGTARFPRPGPPLSHPSIYASLH
jgi:hypothetical protein